MKDVTHLSSLMAVSLTLGFNADLVEIRGREGGQRERERGKENSSQHNLENVCACHVWIYCTCVCVCVCGNVGLLKPLALILASTFCSAVLQL